MTEWLQERSFMLETKSFFIIHVLNFFLEIYVLVGLDPFVVSNVFSYGAIEITNLETNKVLKVNRYWFKVFYEGWTTELTTFIKLAEPIY